MSYISGLGLAIPTSAVSSPTQQSARPRAAAPRAAPTQANAYLQQVYTLRGKQKQLEVLLLKLKQQLEACRDAASGRIQTAMGKPRPTSAACLALEQAIAACVREIQLCAMKAAAAAKAAVSAGATTVQVNVAASAGTASGATAPYVGPTCTPYTVMPAPPSSTPVVESSTASLLPNGQIVPGPGAQVVDTPALTETLPQPSADTESTFQPQDVAVSVGTGSIGTVVVIGVAGVIGYMLAKKRGWL